VRHGSEIPGDHVITSIPVTCYRVFSYESGEAEPQSDQLRQSEQEIVCATHAVRVGAQY
jgi:hypothetical protein